MLTVNRQSPNVRLEALSDGVFSIAMTLLGLDLTASVHNGGPLANVLARGWPSYFAFVTSFVSVNIIWINHHRLFRHISHADHMLLVWNGLLLMMVTLVPFATVVLAQHLAKAQDGEVAAMVYSGVFAALTGTFNLLWRHAWHHQLLHDVVDARVIRLTNIRFGFGGTLYLIAFCVAPISPRASVVIDLLFVGFFALPLMRSRNGGTRGIKTRPHRSARRHAGAPATASLP